MGPRPHPSPPPRPSRPRRRTVLGAGLAAGLGAAGLAGCGAGASAGGKEPIVVAIVSNPQMQDAISLIDRFTAQHPDIDVRFVSLPENEARAKITASVASGGGEFDVVRSFFLEVPGEVLEAASIDGASPLRTMRTVLLPMVAPGVAATALICVIFAWNEFFFALNLTAANAATVPIFLMSTMTSEGLFLARLSAASVLASLPVVLAGWIAQKQLVRGLSMGAVK